MNELSVIGLALAGWLASTWLGYRWGLRSQSIQREVDAKSGIKQRRLEYIAFLKSWATAVDRRYLAAGGFEHDYAAFVDMIPEFVHRSEIVKADMEDHRRKEFDALVTRVVAQRNSGNYDKRPISIQILTEYIEGA
jgi:hypothetical protein